MASGQSSFARNYDKLLLVLGVLLLAGAVLLFLSSKEDSQRREQEGAMDLNSRKPLHPAIDREAAGAKLSSYMNAVSAIDTPFKMVADDSTKNGFFVPEMRVWCVKCRKPIPFESEECPLCGGRQPGKKNLEADPSQDSDGDGLPDLWERSYGFNPLDAKDAGLDFDGDGFSNLEEYAAKTDPTNAASHPDLMAYLRTASIESARLPLLFKAESNMGGGKYKCQFNYSDRELNTVKSIFVKVGDVIGPLDRLPGAPVNAPPRFSDFKLLDLEWREEKVFSKIENREKLVKVPVAIVERISTGRKIEFRKEKESTDSTYLVTLVQTRDGTEYSADGGEGEAEFTIGKEKFLLKKVDGAKGSVVLVRETDKKEFLVPKVEE